jgi:hypothetical protein
VSVSVEATRKGSYLIVKDRWRGPLVRDGATVEFELGSRGTPACGPSATCWPGAASWGRQGKGSSAPR